MSTTFKATIEHVTRTTSKATVRTHTFLVHGSGTGGGRVHAGIAGRLLHQPFSCGDSRPRSRSDERPRGSDGHAGRHAGTVHGLHHEVSAQCPDPELARKLITMAGRACQVVTTLRQVAPIAISYEGSLIELSEAAAVS
jgi:hypothetical protein